MPCRRPAQAVRCLEDKAAAKQGGALAVCLDVLALSVTRHSNANGCLDLTADALFSLVKEHDDGHKMAIQTAALVANEHNSSALVS
jgi:condensin complex subunit 1